MDTKSKLKYIRQSEDVLKSLLNVLCTFNLYSVTSEVMFICSMRHYRVARKIKQGFFIYYLAAGRPTLSHHRGDRLNQPTLITGL